MTYYLLFVLYILEWGYCVRQKQIWMIFLFNFKMCCKVVEIACNINNTVGSGTINEFTVQWWFKRFCRGDKSLDDEERNGLCIRQKLTVTNGEQPLKLILLQLHEKCTCPMTEDEMAGWHHQLDGCESEWTPGVGDGQGGLACCDSWGRKESTRLSELNWTGE